MRKYWSGHASNLFFEWMFYEGKYNILFFLYIHWGHYTNWILKRKFFTFIFISRSNDGNKVLYLNFIYKSINLFICHDKNHFKQLMHPKLRLYKNSLKSILCNTNLSSRHHVPHWKNYKAISPIIIMYTTEKPLDNPQRSVNKLLN